MLKLTRGYCDIVEMLIPQGKPAKKNKNLKHKEMNKILNKEN